MAIRFRGRLEDFSALETGTLPEGAVPLVEGDSLEEVTRAALRQEVPLFVLVVALTVVRLLFGLDWSRGVTIFGVFLGMAAYFLIYVALIFVHELIHALFFPWGTDRDIWIYKNQAALVNYHAIVSRTRFLVMSLAPVVLLGFLPFILWFFLGDRVAPVVAIVWWLESWAMILGGVGDLYNVRNVLAQVPRGAYVLNHGMHTYWLWPKDVNK